MRMDVRKLNHTGNSLTVRLTIATKGLKDEDLKKVWITEEFMMNAAAVFQVKAFITDIDILIFVRFAKLHKQDDLTYIIKVENKNSVNLSNAVKELNITDKNFISDDGTWHLVGEYQGGFYWTFELTVHIDIAPSACPLAILHDDTEVTDFELKGEDGSLSVHRAVLATASPVFKAMLSGKWRESTDGKMDKLNTSKAALQNFKDYLYLDTLPNVVLDLKQLLLLASYYMIKDLEQKCVFKLINMITAENTCDLLEFACKHRVERLLLAILQCGKGGVVEVGDIRFHSLDSEESEK